MVLAKKKLAVFHQLTQETAPISLPQLLEKLGSGYAERSVRRWLTEMATEGAIEKRGRKRATLYRAAYAYSEEQTLEEGCFDEESQKVIQRVRLPLYKRMPVAYADEWFADYEPNRSFYIPAQARLQLHGAGQRLRKEAPAGTYAHQIFNRLLIDLSYNSSRLEGNTYSLLDTQKLLLEGKSAEGKLDEEKLMILNHKEAIRYLVDHAPQLQIDEITICNLHALLSDGLVDHRDVGNIRTQGVRIGGSTYIPFEDPKQLHLRLKQVLEKAASIQDPYEQSFFLLVHLSYLQAFADVNKRTARLCANIPLVKRNLVPLSFNDVEREDYNSAMIAIYELQEVHPLLDLYLFSYMRTCTSYDSTIRALGFDEVRVRYRIERRALIREVILQLLIGKAMEEYVSSHIPEVVKDQDKGLFLEDVMEDLKEMNQNRIAGLGITLEQLEHWLKLKNV